MIDNTDQIVNVIETSTGRRVYTPKGFRGPTREELYWRRMLQLEEASFYCVQKVFEHLYCEMKISPEYVFLCEEDYLLVCRDYLVQHRHHIIGNVITEETIVESSNRITHLINFTNGKPVQFGYLASLKQYEMLIWYPLP